MASTQSQTTTDHNTIRRWAEARGGVPAHVRQEGEDSGILRIHFPGFGEDEQTFEEISWNEFFEQFEENNLAFLYQEETKEGDESRFFKLISREKA